MEFEDQITDLQLVIDNKPRVYIKWKYTQEGRDKTDSYERIEIDKSVIYYINANNRNFIINPGNPFFDKLEKLYNQIKTQKYN